MTLWMLLLIVSVGFILLGMLLDFTAKKKGYRFQTDESSKGSSESPLITQVHVNHAIGSADSANP
jgi:hypothetical protein